jgi:hypothetical protein
LGDWVISGATQRMTSGEPAQAERAARQKSVTLDRLGGVIRARR